MLKAELEKRNKQLEGKVKRLENAIQEVCINALNNSCEDAEDYVNQMIHRSGVEIKAPLSIQLEVEDINISALKYWSENVDSHKDFKLFHKGVEIKISAVTDIEKI